MHLKIIYFLNDEKELAIQLLELRKLFAEENIGRVWTIVSNEEKNVARIEEGHLWK